MANLSATRRINSESALKNALHWSAVLLVVLALIFGIYQTIHSSLFLLKTIKVNEFSPDYPISKEKVLDLIKIPIDKISLFDLNLAPLEARLIKNPWIKGAIIGKQFPDTLSMTILERKPVALFAEPSGRITYLDEDGTSFDDQSLLYPKDLPLMSGFSGKDVASLRRANQFIATWFSGAHFPDLKVSSLSYDEKLGLRAVVAVLQKNQKQMRIILELGLNFEDASLVPYEHFQKVLQYLSDHSIQVSKVWLGNGKKIVVKVLKGS